MRCSQGCAPPSKTFNKTRPATPFLRMRGLPPAVPRHRRCRPRLCKGSTTLLKSGMGCRRKASHRRVMDRIDCFSLGRRWLISRTRFKCFRPPEIKLLGPVHTRHCLCRETSLVGMLRSVRLRVGLFRTPLKTYNSQNQPSLREPLHSV